MAQAMTGNRLKRPGIEMSEKDIKDHLKVFSDMEESIQALYKQKKTDYNKSKNKLKRRNQV